jgi:hypothetical protein
MLSGVRAVRAPAKHLDYAMGQAGHDPVETLRRANAARLRAT